MDLSEESRAQEGVVACKRPCQAGTGLYAGVQREYSDEKQDEDEDGGGCLRAGGLIPNLIDWNTVVVVLALFDKLK